MASPAADGFTLRGSLRLGKRYLIKLGLPTSTDRDAARRQLASAPGVRRVTEDPIPRPVAFTFTQADSRLGEQWAHEERFANTLNAWDKVAVADQAKIIVAVLDTGLDTAHPEFTGRLEGARNFTIASPDADVTDNQGHGTHVTGIVGATGNNGAGVAGVAWGVKLMPVKVLGDAGTGGTFDIIQGITYATGYEAADGSRVRVINMSLGTPSGSVDAYYAEAIAAAREAGILVVAATGNDGRGVVGQPATTPHALAVGATAHYLAWERLAAFSNYGDRLDLVAPGEEILSTLPGVVTGFGKDYGVVSGTSMSAPYVSGVAALVMAKYDKTNASRTAAFVDKVRARLIAACDDLGAPGRDPIYGAGRLNAARAVTPGTIDAAP
jgi:subtilisin family serine protease